MELSQLDEVHRFWFGEGDVNPALKASLWFGASPEIDAEIGSRFGESIDEAASTPWTLGALTPRQRLGLVILLDQFPRNVHRGTPRVYVHDALARDISRATISFAFQGYSQIEGMFLILPFGHSESLADQDLALDLFKSSIEPFVSTGEGFWAGAKRQAHLYRDIIARFGRFPHRNVVLGRKTTPEEALFLAETKMTP